MLRRVPYKWLVATAFVFGLFMEILDMTVLNTALPALGRHFGAGTETLQWLVTGYLVSMAVFIPASGWVADRFGTKRTFLFALAVFTAASAWGGFAGSLGELIVARVVQGVGGGLLTPVGTAMLFRAFPPAERAKASAVLSIPTTIAPAFGPVLGGWMVDNISWRWIFFLKVPIGVLGILFAAVALREERADHPGRFDAAGFLSGGAALALLLLGLDRGAREGWGTPAVLVPLGAGLALAAAFCVIELARAEPMIDLRLLKDRLFRTGNLLMLPASGALMGALFLVPLLLQYQMGVDATGSGLVTMFQALGMVALLPLAGRLYPKLGPRRLLATGFAVIAAAQAILITVDPGTTLWVVRLSLFVMGAGMALTVIPLQAASFATITPAAITRASSVFSTTRQVASAAGVAVAATLLTTRTDSRLGDLGDRAADLTSRQGALFAAYHDIFLVTTALALLGFLVALRVRDADAITSMRPAPAVTGADR
ncbi:multidrug efflux MFS transporter [Streptosporangium sp. NBC_01755]|uniref:MDR family MFS transporter n=1 Tax=unclassified Streptosporangium TaxID=2632669 RepID=UPI002DD8CA49|nr:MULTISPECIES: MDR family MFS transporter [unclassified Streptosporangium]WSA28302.1 multidrug efflux MFS transporter [Streptosporangium sp. NBC_01810]WSD00220.1 multidrug efflux MFS transporter [Streptosporangium sp. NBC_01755]